jgi:hypothetical protein
MSNTVKIKNKKKKSDFKVNYKLWAIVFGVFVALIVAGSVWASFHWGVGIGSIGKKPMSSEDAAAAASEIASEFSTDAVVLTPEQMEELGIVVNGEAGTEDAAADDAAAEDAGAEDAASEEAGADDAAAKDAESE